MLSKAVLSFVGRLVGIAAVLVSPLAGAAESSDAPSGEGRAAKTTDAPAARPAAAAAHAHRHRNAEKKAKHRGHHAGASGENAGNEVKESKEAKEATEIKPAHEAKAGSAGVPVAAHCDDPAVVTERASAKTPPKQSTTPLPTLAAVTSKPLIEPISTHAEVAIESRGHALEPRRTPVVRASLHTRSADDAPAHKEKHAKTICLNAPVNVTRGTEEETFPLTKCDGSALSHAVDEMSVLVRPGNAAKPTAPIGEEKAKLSAASKGEDLAPGIKKIDERLVERLQLVIDHFAKPGDASSKTSPRIFVVSGYRPTSKGSFHAMGRAIDFRLDGVENTDLVAFCKTLPDTGCGFYPNSSFIHLDVRDSGSGHVSWIDASNPGEKPDYVAAWPPPPNDEDPVKLLARLDELQLLPPPEHDQPADPGKKADKADKADKAEKAERAENSEKPRKSEKPSNGDKSDKSEKCPDEPASLTRKIEDQ